MYPILGGNKRAREEGPGDLEEEGRFKRLREAARSESPAAVRQLLDTGIYSEASRVSTLAGLVIGRHYAMYTSNVHEVIDLLLERPFLSEESRDGALHAAVTAGHYEFFEKFPGAPFLIPHRERAVNKEGSNGELNAVKKLLVGGEITQEGRGSAVQNAARYGQFEIVQALLANGEISIKDREEAVRLAAFYGDAKSVKALLANGDGISEEAHAGAVLAAAAECKFEAVEALLLGEGVCPISDENRGKAVIKVVDKGKRRVNDSLKVIDSLLKRGAILDEQYEEAIDLATAKDTRVNEALVEWRDYHRSYLFQLGAQTLRSEM